MATGDVTSTYEGAFVVNSAAFLTELDTLNTGAATAGADTKTIHIIPDGVREGIVHIVTIARAA